MKKIFKCLALSFFALVLGVGSFLIPKHFNKKSLLIAKADSVTEHYSFHASDMYSFDSVDVSNNTKNVLPVLFTADFYTSDDGLYVRPVVLSVTTSSTSIYYSPYTYAHFTTNNSSWTHTYYQNFTLINTSTNYRVLYNNNSSNYASFPIFSLFISVSSDFNCNVYKVSTTMTTTNPYQDAFAGYKYLNFIYYDVNDNTIMFSFVVPESYYFNDRTYYFVNPSTFVDSQQYNAGYQQGLADNQQNIYDNGYDAGNSTGYNNGYSAGVAAANNYSFVGLIGAVVDVPVKTLMGLLNFEVLGINLFGFLTGLLTFALIIFIIKLILGGK